MATAGSLVMGQAHDPQLTILIVEDDALIALALQTFVEDAGHKVLGLADNGRDAHEICRWAAPDLVLMDIDPGRGGDGRRVAEGIHRAFGIRSVLVGSNVTPQMAEHPAPCAAGYLRKPFPPSALRDVLKEIVEAA